MDTQFVRDRITQLRLKKGVSEYQNADLLKNTVSEVLVTRQNVKLRLKNGQIIERSDLQ